MRPERVWIENVQPFAHNVLLRHAVLEHERPKLDRYSSHLLLSAYAVDLDEATGALSKHLDDLLCRSGA